MPNFTSGPDGQENLGFGCLSKDPTVRFTGHFAELEQVCNDSQPGADCAIARNGGGSALASFSVYWISSRTTPDSSNR